MVIVGPLNAVIDSVGPRPWLRVKDPQPLPETSKPALLARQLRELDENSLGRLIRDHLVPLSSDRSYRTRWNGFWSSLGFDPVLRDRATGIINNFLDLAEGALEANDQDDNQTKRTEKFFDRCEGALDRILKREDEPLAWAGAAAMTFNPPARAVIDQLVSAIEKHRSDLDNEALWATLDSVRKQSLGGSGPRKRRSQR